MLSSTLTIEQDPDNDDNTIQSTIVDGLGFYSAQDTAPRGFHVDEVSFSSEMRQFEPEYVSSQLTCTQRLSVIAIANFMPVKISATHVSCLHST